MMDGLMDRWTDEWIDGCWTSVQQHMLDFEIYLEVKDHMQQDIIG